MTNAELEQWILSFPNRFDIPGALFELQRRQLLRASKIQLWPGKDSPHKSRSDDKSRRNARGDGQGIRAFKKRFAVTKVVSSAAAPIANPHRRV
jgi:hypothetical protein